LLDRPLLSYDAMKSPFRALVSLHLSFILLFLEFMSTYSHRFLLLSIVVRNRVKYAQFRQKKMNTNPGRGPFHFKSPAMMVWRTIRGMSHHMTARGQDALKRLSTFEGIPAPFDKQQRVVVPAALRVMRLKPGRDYTILGDLAHTIGWKHRELLSRLEGKRKADSKDFYEKKKSKQALRRKAEAAASKELAKPNAVLAAAGY
jgi:large subunit ribosomal protein L13Ae